MDKWKGRNAILKDEDCPADLDVVLPTGWIKELIGSLFERNEQLRKENEFLRNQVKEISNCAEAWMEDYIELYESIADDAPEEYQEYSRKKPFLSVKDVQNAIKSMRKDL